jgi:hypothetical protein
MYIETEFYFEHTAKEKTYEFFQVRKCRPTASRFYMCIEDTTFSTIDEIAEIICGNKKQVYSDKSMISITRGLKYESYVRKLYCEYTNYRVRETGLIIPKFDQRIGGISDGFVYENINGKYVETEGILEIKCPDKMIPNIENLKFENEQEIIPSYNYTQIQACMKMSNKKWCDYVVYCDNKIFIYKIHFNQNYWDQFYPKLDNFIENILYKKTEKRPIYLKTKK